MTAAQVFVRLALPEDANTFIQHQQASTEEASRYRGSVVAQTPQGDDLRIVAGVGNTVFGTLTATPITNSRWFVTHVYVDPQAREIGLGDALLDFAMTEVAQRGGTWLGGQALPGDRAMKNLFERHGLVAQTIWVGKDL